MRATKIQGVRELTHILNGCADDWNVRHDHTVWDNAVVFAALVAHADVGGSVPLRVALTVSFVAARHRAGRALATALNGHTDDDAEVDLNAVARDMIMAASGGEEQA